MGKKHKQAPPAPAPAAPPPLGQKKEEVYGYQTYFRELGYYITRREQYERALKAFDQAIQKTPDDKRALMGRSWARAKAVQYQGALDDINKALKLDGEDLRVLAHKALNTYLSCEFEDALVQNLRKIPIRKKPDSFVMGVMHCNEAIENCIGIRAGRPLRDHYKIIRYLAWKKIKENKKRWVPKNKKKKKKKVTDQEKQKSELVSPLKKRKEIPKMKFFSEKSFSEILKPQSSDVDLAIRDSLYSHLSEKEDIPPCPPFPYRPLQRRTTNLENYMAEKYLDKLYLDKIFLREFRQHPGVESPNGEGTKKILKLARDGYKLLSYKQELLRTRRPFYFLKYQETKLSGKLLQKQQEELRERQEKCSQDAEELIEAIKACIAHNDAKEAIDMSEKLKEYCEKTPKKYLTKRDIYLRQMYALMSKAFLIMKRHNPNLFEWDQEKRITAMLGVPPERVSSKDSVLYPFKGVFVDWKKMIKKTEDRLKKADNSEELAWLYHELSRYHLETKQFEIARVYARKCISEGFRINNLNWVINAMMHMARVYIQQHNRNDAKTEVAEALALSKKMNNPRLEEYLEKTLEVIEKVDFDDVGGLKIVEKREQQIIQMMAESGMKEEVAHLFRKMSVMPAARRMSVMPGVKFDEKPQDQSGRKASTRKMSIMGGPKQEEEEIKPKSTEPKHGVGFMELIQYHVD